MKMKDDDEFHLALSVMNWYNHPSVPLNIEEKKWRDTHTKEQAIKLATKYSSDSPDEMRQKAIIGRDLKNLRTYVRRYPSYRITKPVLRKIRHLLRIGASWNQIVIASHHSKTTIMRYLNGEKACAD